jgi:hypothetical protein
MAVIDGLAHRLLIDPGPVDAGGMAVIDGGDAMGQVLAGFAMKDAIRRAKAHGIVIARGEFYLAGRKAARFRPAGRSRPGRPRDGRQYNFGLNCGGTSPKMRP